MVWHFRLGVCVCVCVCVCGGGGGGVGISDMKFENKTGQ